MFCAEYNGRLITGTIKHTAREVREAVATLFKGETLKNPWKKAMRDGWRVVPVMVERRSEWLKRR